MLSSEGRRSQYDSSLDGTDVRDPVPVTTYQGYDSFHGWWGMSKTTWFVAGVILIGLAYAGQRYFVAHTDSGVRNNAIREGAAVDRMRASNEGSLFQGLVNNQAADIANRAQVQNRVIGVAETAEQRHARELDYRARTTSQQLELQRQQQEARLRMDADRQNASILQQQRSAQMQADRAEAARVEREQRYYSCMSAAAALQGSVDKAKLQCLNYR